MTNPLLLELPVPIKTPRLLLRHSLPGDGVQLNAAIRESFDELSKWVPWADHVPSVEESEIIVRKSYAQWILREDLRLLIFDSAGKSFIGSTGLHRIHWEVPTFEVGYWVRNSCVGKGFISEAVNAVTRYAFKQLKAKRVELRIDEDNHKSIKVVERLGFELEGKLRASSLGNDKKTAKDIRVYSLLELKNLPDLEISFPKSTT